MTSYGEDRIPALATIQSTLSARGTTLGVKLKESSKKVSYVRFAAGAVEKAHAAAVDSGLKPRARMKSKKDRSSGQITDSHETLQSKVDGLLARPLSAFTLFGLAQRGVLKKQKSTVAVKDIVKAVGERWLLLCEAERKKYEAMAEEDALRSERVDAWKPEVPAKESEAEMLRKTKWKAEVAEKESKCETSANTA